MFIKNFKMYALLETSKIKNKKTRNVLTANNNIDSQVSVSVAVTKKTVS